MEMQSNFACQYCVYAATKRGNYEQHVRSQHEKVKEICEVCGKGFSEKSNINKHVRKFHPEIEQKDEESGVTPNVNKRKANDTLENEPKKSKGISRMRCSTCTAEVKELKNLNKHIKNIHSNKSIKCNDCSYTTNDSYNFQRHKEGCNKRKREEEVKEQVAKRAWRTISLVSAFLTLNVLAFPSGWNDLYVSK